jgi:TRAP-type C4-dicarboxylate transport system permease small subunit
LGGFYQITGGVYTSKKNIYRTVAFSISSLPLLLPHLAFAASTTAGVSSIESFIRSVITVIASLAGLVATGFFVVGGFTYITSSGNPRNLEKAKRTLFYSALGLAITVAAFVISDIVTTLATNAFGNS